GSPRPRHHRMSDGAAILDGQLLHLETAHPDFERARDELVPLVEVVKTPEALHTYRLSPLSIWNAVSLGISANEIVARLRRHSRLPIGDIDATVRQWADRSGALTLRASSDGRLELEARTPEILDRVLEHEDVKPILTARDGARAWAAADDRGRLKQAL